MSITESIEKARYASRYLKLAEKSAHEADENLQHTLSETERKIEQITLTQREAAGFAGCDESTVWRHRQNGKLKSLLVVDVIDWKRKYRPGRRKFNSEL